MICLFLALSYYLSFFTKMDLLWRLLYLNYNLVILEKTVKSLVCLFMTSVSLIQIFAICVGVYLTTSPLPQWLTWLVCDKLSLLHLTSISVKYWYIVYCSYPVVRRMTKSYIANSCIPITLIYINVIIVFTVSLMVLMFLVVLIACISNCISNFFYG